MPETPTYIKKEQGMFKGMIKISDGDNCRKYVKYIGRFTCNNCHGAGHQVLTAWKHNFPKGIAQEDIQSQMQEAVVRNHICHLSIH